MEGLPELIPPPSCTARHYRPGDDHAWEQIIHASFGGNSHSFTETIASKPPFRPERVWFIECEGKPVATASAWRDAHYGEHTGYVHMVGALPNFKGQKLGYWVSVAVLRQLAAEGVHHAVLQTDDFRLPAIVTYARLGFRPLIVHENQPRRWGAIYSKLGPAVFGTSP